MNRFHEHASLATIYNEEHHVSRKVSKGPHFRIIPLFHGQMLFCKLRENSEAASDKIGMWGYSVLVEARKAFVCAYLCVYAHACICVPHVDL